MEQRELGRSGVSVSRLVLGCGNFGGVGSAPALFGQGIPHDEAFRIMDAAWELGLTTFDTADAYGGGRSETWIGEWLATKGSDVRGAITIGTKTFNPMDEVPGEAAFAFVAAFLLKLYAAIAVIVPLHLTPFQVTQCGLMMGIAHNLIVEGASSPPRERAGGC